MKKTILNKIFLVSLIGFLLVSCKSQKDATYSVSNISSFNVYFSALKKQTLNSYVVSFTGMVSESNKSQKFDGKLSIYNDSLATISLVSKSFGIEAFKILLSNDSIIILNRLSKTTIKSTPQYFNRKYGILLSTNQFIKLISGVFFNPVFSSDTLGYNLLSINSNQNSYIFTYNPDSVRSEYYQKILNPDLHFTSIILPNGVLKSSTYTISNRNLTFIASFGEPFKNSWPSEASYNFNGLGLEASANLQYNEISKMKTTKLNFVIPKSYNLVLW